MGDMMRVIEFRLSRANHRSVIRSRCAWGERLPALKHDVNARRQRGEADRLRNHQRALGKLPPLAPAHDAAAAAGKPKVQWRPAAGMVVLLEPLPVIPIMEAPERRPDGRRIEKTTWFAQSP